jgi:hypothetical protein
MTRAFDDAMTLWMQIFLMLLDLIDFKGRTADENIFACERFNAKSDPTRLNIVCDYRFLFLRSDRHLTEEK